MGVTCEYLANVMRECRIEYVDLFREDGAPHASMADLRWAFAQRVKRESVK
jgi:hypothetical protein